MDGDDGLCGVGVPFAWRDGEVVTIVVGDEVAVLAQTISPHVF